MLIFWLRVVVLNFFLFFTSNNVLVTLERLLLLLLKCNPASFVFSDLWIWYLTEAFRSKFLDYIFWFSKKFYIIYYVSQIFSYWCTCFFHCIAPVFSTRSFSLLFSDSESLLLMAKLTFEFLVVSTSRPICSSKSEQPNKDSSSSAGGWLSPTFLTTFLFTLKFVKVYNFFSISSLILFMFLAWLFVRTSARFVMMFVSLFYCKFSRVFIKHALIVLP